MMNWFETLVTVGVLGVLFCIPVSLTWALWQAQGGFTPMFLLFSAGIWLFFAAMLGSLT